MTADEWDCCPRSDWMLLPLHEWLLANPASARPFDRKLRLYAVACCHQRWGLFEADLFRRAVDAAERFADGQADKQELVAIYDAIMALPTLDAQSHCIENMTLKLTGGGGMTAATAAAINLAVATGWGESSRSSGHRPRSYAASSATRSARCPSTRPGGPRPLPASPI